MCVCCTDINAHTICLSINFKCVRPRTVCSARDPRDPLATHDATRLSEGHTDFRSFSFFFPPTPNLNFFHFLLFACELVFN